MWLVDALKSAFLTLFVGFLLVVPFKSMLDGLLATTVATIPGLSDFEDAVMSFYPVAILLVVFLGAIMCFQAARRER